MEQGALWKPLALGVLLGATLDHFVLRKRLKGLHVFMHELAHAVAALLFFRKVTRFVATQDSGGFVQHRGRFGGAPANALIALAPYFWPTLTVGCVLVRPLLLPGYFPWYDILVGATFGFHLMASARDLKNNCSKRIFCQTGTGKPVETDISRSGGLAVSAMYIFLAALTVYGLLCAVVLNGYPGVIRWAEVVEHYAWNTAGVLLALAEKSIAYL